MAKFELEALDERLEAKRVAATTRAMFGLGRRIGEDEQARRWQRLWCCLALDWIDNARAVVPPTDWAFMNKLEAHLQGTAKKEKEPLAYSDTEKRAWRSFNAWHSQVAKDMQQLADLLAEHTKHPCDSLLQQRLIDRGFEVKEKYRDWLEAGRILWMPMHWSRLEGGNRAPCNVVEYAAEALKTHEQDPPRSYTPAEFHAHAATLRKEFDQVRERFEARA